MSTEMPKEISQNLASWAVASWVCGELGGGELGGGELGGGELGGVEMSVYRRITSRPDLSFHSNRFHFASGRGFAWRF